MGCFKKRWSLNIEKEPSGVTTIKKMYSVLGENIQFQDIEGLLEKATQGNQKKIFGAVSRIMLVDTIQKVKSGLSAWELVNLDALQVYLHCTSIDALADHSKKVGERFTGIIKELPKSVLEELVQAYIIIREPEENIDYWERLTIDIKVERVIDYFYLLRRNTFTHEAQIVPTATATSGITGLVLFILPNVWGYSVYFNYRNPKYSEIRVLRLIVIVIIRQILDLPVDSGFVQSYWRAL